MKRYILVTTLLVLFAGSFSVLALGGGGAKSAPEDDTVRISLKPVQDDPTVYGWVRITPNKFAVGANHLEPKNYYAVYLVSGDKREAMSENPVRRSFGDGEFKFETKLKEPFGGEWDKIVLYHRPNGEKDPSGEVPILEGNIE